MLQFYLDKHHFIFCNRTQLVESVTYLIHKINIGNLGS